MVAIVGAAMSSNRTHTQDRDQVAQSLREREDNTFVALEEKHQQKYGVLKLKLWARMIVAGIHSSTATPPSITAFTGKPVLSIN